MNTNGPFVLAVDCGTQSIRGLVFDKKGIIVAQEKLVYDPPYVSDQPEWAERDPALYYEELVQILRTLREKNEKIMESIAGLTITTQRDTTIVLDKDLNVLRPAILWLDKRKIKKARPIHPIYEAGTRIIGMKKTIEDFSKTTPAHWLMENEKNVWKKVHKYVLLSTYLHYKITGKLVDSISAQTGHMPFNFKKQEWEGPFGLKGQIFQIPKKMLYPIHPAGTILGNVSESFAKDSGLAIGLPVLASGSDKACETLGTGCVDEKTASLSLGSQATIETASSRYYEVQPFIPPFPSAIPGIYNPEITVYRGFWMVSWFRDEFAFEEKLASEKMGIPAEELLNQRIDSIEPGSKGLMLQPFWGNELTRPESRGAIIGFSEEHTKYHIYRAILEGIGYALKEGLLKIEAKSKVEVEKISISGGGAQSDIICQMMADIFGRSIYKVQTSETSGLGAAICAFVGLGVYPDFETASKEMIRIVEGYVPDERKKSIYLDLYEGAYKRLYHRLKPIYMAMEKIDDIDNP
ncbi:FGGY-family carbohydrate kinase [Alkalibacter rhizosphaerae]|uniref:FGGY-family carbohydrate kinase n=1 Tax=Alkalibacter rhizosphaerae TaxID=2815577 RepID=A0A975AIW1_9FIRM|nr:FGGY-family carbohydrate kinase [Alkalibacter rhizosphaerae]QSX08950.1 FGGY-family carbohydrate kinase [Alkalibacter rhizosphaerae]